jgi:hypothetical protein
LAPQSGTVAAVPGGPHDGPGTVERPSGLVEGPAGGSGDFTDGHAALVEPSAVVEVVRREWFGHVYNLETETGIYNANGVIVHNCRCRTIWRQRRSGRFTAAATRKAAS